MKKNSLLYHLSKHLLIKSFIQNLKRSLKHHIEKFNSLYFHLKKTDPFLYIKKNINQKIKNNKRIFIVGNGPSINNQNLNLLQNEFTICSNAFFLKYHELNWRPSIYTVEDPLPAKDNYKFFNNDKDSLKVIPNDLKNFFKNPNICYINFNRFYLNPLDKNWPLFSNNISDVAYWGGSVSFLSIQIAAMFNPKEIILLGTDLSYSIPRSAIINNSVITSTEDDPNHFNPSYFGKGKRWHLPEVGRMQKGFDKAKEVLDQSGIKLLNATDKGNLKNIRRVNYDDLFSK